MQEIGPADPNRDGELSLWRRLGQVADTVLHHIGRAGTAMAGEGPAFQLIDDELRTRAAEADVVNQAMAITRAAAKQLPENN